MSIDELGRIINGTILFILGLLIILLSKAIAKACLKNKVKIFGESKFDGKSELITKIGIIFIGICFCIGAVLQILNTQ